MSPARVAGIADFQSQYVCIDDVTTRVTVLHQHKGQEPMAQLVAFDYASEETPLAAFGCNTAKSRVITELHPVAIIARNTTGWHYANTVPFATPSPCESARFLQNLSRSARAFCSGVTDPD